VAEEVKDIEQMLERIEQAAEGKERVSVGRVMEAIGSRSFEPLLLFAGVILVSPLCGIPGMPTTMSLFVMLIAAQPLLRKDHFWLPQQILEPLLDRTKLTKTTRRLWRPAQRGTRPVAIFCARIALGPPATGLMRTAAATAVLVLALAGCSSSGTVKCSEQPEDPRPVFLLDHGRHRTLVLTDQEGDLIRYGYGDWQYYAEVERGFWSGARALLWPTSAALGRQEYDVEAPTPKAVKKAVRVGILEVYPFKAAGDAVDVLLQELDQLFREGAKQKRVVSYLRDFEFVPHPRHYWLGYNSNHVVVDWLEELDCDLDR
jgi:hypothetical protein